MCAADWERLVNRGNADEVRAHYARLAATYDRKANPACKRAYGELVETYLPNARRVLELGAGSGPLLGGHPGSLRVAYDLSAPMLKHMVVTGHLRVAGDARKLPFQNDCFDACFSINLLEHVPDPGAVLCEAARVLTPGGVLLAVTPNGDREWLLHWIERLHLKLPEGPHAFVTMEKMRSLTPPSLRVLEHRPLLTLPAGPRAFVRLMDRVLPNSGLFQFTVMQKT